MTINYFEDKAQAKFSMLPGTLPRFGDRPLAVPSGFLLFRADHRALRESPFRRTLHFRSGSRRPQTVSGKNAEAVRIADGVEMNG